MLSSWRQTMRKKHFSEMLTQIKDLTPKQLNALISAADQAQTARTPAVILDEKFAENLACPRCQSQDIRKWGIESGIQRYCCNGCRRTFNALTGTPMARLRKKDLWLEYSDALADGDSLTKAATRCGIDRTTAFRWRHRFLTRPKENQPRCSGITEIDETYFLESYKGTKVCHRPSRKRGGKSQTPGLSAEQIPVIIVRDRGKQTCDAVLTDRSARGIKRKIGHYISQESILCIDKSRALIKFAKKSGMAFETLDNKQRRGRDKVFHIQNVNAYHSRLKEWMKRFHGVSTKHLSSYLGWRRLFERNVNSPTALLQETIFKICNG
jgi:transposase-like protein